MFFDPSFKIRCTSCVNSAVTKSEKVDVVHRWRLKPPYAKASGDTLRESFVKWPEATRSFSEGWRRERDSNPRTLAGYTLSKRAH